MDSKNVFLILGLLAMVLVISSEVSARDLAETSTNAKEEVVEKPDEINNYGGYYGGYGGYGGYGPGSYGPYNGGGYQGGQGGASDEGNR